MIWVAVVMDDIEEVDDMMDGMEKEELEVTYDYFNNNILHPLPSMDSIVLKFPRGS